MIAHPPERPLAQDEPDRLLGALGSAIRASRGEAGLTLKQLAEQSGLSARFLSDLETGKGNVSVLRLAEVARAVGTTASSLLARAEIAAARTRDEAGSAARSGVVALLGLRGAGKSTIGARAAKALGIPFVELDERIAARAGMSAGEMFDLHGATYYRRAERAELERLLAHDDPAIVATAGNIVGDSATFELLLGSTTTIWLRATPEDHYTRVVAQGDTRPMANRKNAMQELRELLRARRALYERAEHTIDTSRLGLERATNRVVAIARETLQHGSAAITRQ